MIIICGFLGNAQPGFREMTLTFRSSSESQGQGSGFQHCHFPVPTLLPPENLVPGSLGLIGFFSPSAWHATFWSAEATCCLDSEFTSNSPDPTYLALLPLLPQSCLPFPGGKYFHSKSMTLRSELAKNPLRALVTEFTSLPDCNSSILCLADWSIMSKRDWVMSASSIGYCGSQKWEQSHTCEHMYSLH